MFFLKRFIKNRDSYNYQKLRIIILTLSILSFLLSLIGGGLYYFKVKSSLSKEAHQQCITTITNVNKGISLFLLQYRLASEVLSKLDEIKSCIEDPNRENLQRANSVLDIFSSSFKIDVAYLMDRNGVTIASSNRKYIHSFVGMC